jgi:hypothetical protein
MGTSLIIGYPQFAEISGGAFWLLYLPVSGFWPRSMNR